jgi:ubiquinone/menaquinone biosynthesis C-methylase UbiE
MLSSSGDDFQRIDVKMIKITNERFQEHPAKNSFHIKGGNAAKLEYPDAFFDIILAIRVLLYTSCWESVLTEIHRSLKPTGVFVCTFFYRFSPQWFSTVLFYRPLLPIINLIKGRSIKSLLLRFKGEPLPFSYRKFVRALSNLGFRDIQVRHSEFTYFPFNRLFPTISSRLALKPESLLHDSRVFAWLCSVCMVKAMKP